MEANELALFADEGGGGTCATNQRASSPRRRFSRRVSRDLRCKKYHFVRYKERRDIIRRYNVRNDVISLSTLSSRDWHVVDFEVIDFTHIHVYTYTHLDIIIIN